MLVKFILQLLCTTAMQPENKTLLKWGQYMCKEPLSLSAVSQIFLEM